MFHLKDPYEYFAYGKTCATPNKCVGCTLGECIQYAHAENADGFSYKEKGDVSRWRNKTGKCRLCRTEHLMALPLNADWQVYKKKST